MLERFAKVTVGAGWVFTHAVLKAMGAETNVLHIY